MHDSELHTQASLWRDRSHRTAVLVMEGQARDHTTGGTAIDALHRVVLARGLRLTTDLAYRDPRPTPGWRVRIDGDRTITLVWPRFRPLLDHAPVDLPPGWLRTALSAGQIELFVAYGLGIRGPGHAESLPSRLDRAARTGAVAAGVLTLLSTATPETITLPRQRGTADAPEADTPAADHTPRHRALSPAP
jgi:hypothetical protein